MACHGKETAFMSRKRSLSLAVVIGLAALSCPLTANAQVSGFRIEGGPAFLTKSGGLSFGTDAIESDAGIAIRARLRWGLGPVSVSGELQTSSQDYGQAPAPGAPTTLNATFLGVTGAIHPFRVIGIAPYGEVGIGKLSYSDDLISTDNSSPASIYGVGFVIAGEGRLGVDVGLRLMRQTSLTIEGITSDFKYDPKVFSVLLSLKL